jgi:hypothetical protein
LESQLEGAKYAFHKELGAANEKIVSLEAQIGVLNDRLRDSTAEATALSDRSTELQGTVDSQSERPYTRGFTFNPADLCKEQRQGLVAAVLTLLRGFITAGSPKVSSASVGSFSEWDASVRQAVLWIAQNVASAAMLGDPLESILSRAESDPVDEALSALMVSWRTIFSDKFVTTRELVDVHRNYRDIYGQDSPQRRMADALEELSYAGNPTAKGVGKMLSFKRDRIVGGLQIVRATVSRDGVSSWAVREMSA